MITKTMKNRIVVAFLCLVLLFSAFFPLLPIRASAESTEHTGVLEDLERDESFDPTKYPDNPNDNSLQVITLAEGANGELYVYVYQPSHKTRDLVATEIRIAMPRLGVDLEVEDYSLQLVSTAGVFDKYCISGLNTDMSEGIYDVICIYRPYLDGIDDPPPEGQIISSQDIDVSMRFKFETVNGKRTVSARETKTVDITEKYVGYVRYKNTGFALFPSACDSHFVAFSTDWSIDKLMEADLTYVYQQWGRSTGPFLSGEPSSDGDALPGKANLNYLDMEVVYDGHGWFADTYKWNRIETMTEFLGDLAKSETDYVITENTSLIDFAANKFVLRFTETPYTVTVNSYAGSTTELWTKISDVSILRLKFEADGEVYNLGVVDNKQTGPNSPSFIVNDNDKDNGIPNWLIIVIFVLCVSVLLNFVGPIKAVVGVVIDGVSGAVQTVIDLVIWPFQAVGDLFKGGKGRRR